jgi:UDPglucose--hexose-1-phosphate uridylyltransferase
VIERRFDPTLGEWRTFTATRAAEADGGACRFCPTADPRHPTDVPADSYQLAVLDDPFPPLSADPVAPTVASDGMYRAQPAVGASEIVLYSDQHGRGLVDLDDVHVARLIDVWADRYAVLGAREDIEYVFVFEDGAAPGISAAHPYGQVHGYPEIPPLMARELDAASTHQQERGSCLFCDIVGYERTDGRRVVAQNDSFLAFVPFAARFPYELHIYSQRHVTSLLDCTDPERLSLARMLRTALRAYQEVRSRAPYVMSMHQAPTDDGQWLPVSHLHIEMAPLQPMTASQVGAGSCIGDCLPERAAADLKAAVTRSPGGERGVAAG